jgi:hypothetical protein
MPRKRLKQSTIKDALPDDGPMYVSMAGDRGNEALASHVLPDNPVFLTEPSMATAGSTVVTQRAGFNRYDRDRARPEDATSMTHAEIIKACQAVYRRIGLVRNIIDLMADFASSGLDLIHPNRQAQKFYREWAKRTKLQDRAHDFMKLLLRDANVIVRRKMAKITLPALRQMMTRGDETEILAEPVEKILKQKKLTNARVIPWRYVFISPAICEKVGGELAKFYGSDTVAMQISPALARAIANPKNDAERRMIAKLPDEVKVAAKGKKKLVPLDPAKTFVTSYKKDDWEDWGTPFLYSVLDDILFKDKLRQADVSALDGVINVIRLWKLGNADKQILPTKTAVNKLIGILENNVGGGVLDLVWDDLISLDVQYPPTDKILGPEKYQSVNQDIVRGLGVPDSLLGGSDLSTRNSQTAFVQLKTLVERLNYVRDRCLEWIQNEIKIVAEAMGYKKLPTIVFGTMNLRDEAAEKSLVIQLLDRGIISIETVHKVFGNDFLIELEHLREEEALRKAEPPILERANPYYRPRSILDAQTQGQIDILKAQAKLMPKPAATGPGGGGSNPRGDQPRNDSTPSGPGRPANQKSTKPRDRRTPVTMSAVYESLGHDFLKQIDTIMDPLYLASAGLKNIRTASAEQRKELEISKFAVLCCLRRGDSVTETRIREALCESTPQMLAPHYDLYQEFVQMFVTMCSRAAGLEDRRRLMVSAWAQLVNSRQ